MVKNDSVFRSIPQEIFLRALDWKYETLEYFFKINIKNIFDQAEIEI